MEKFGIQIVKNYKNKKHNINVRKVGRYQSGNQNPYDVIKYPKSEYSVNYKRTVSAGRNIGISRGVSI